jgi:peptidoglycan/xylan/chitin deacetylase (PgdA/CDA1 family)
VHQRLLSRHYGLLIHSAYLPAVSPSVGNVTYDGEGISNRIKDGDIALTFDDGPFNFTGHLLDVLASYDAKATFFITGNNLEKGQIDVEETGWPKIIRRMHREGHQIAAHAWSSETI